MNAIVNSSFAWLLKREYWESRRSFVWAQVWTAGVIVGITLLGIIATEVWRVHAENSLHVSISGLNLSQMLGYASSHDMAAIVAGLNATMLWFAGIASIVLSFVVFFYLLGALYDDRRDRSILFWKSLPVSDTATVLSKVVTAIIVAPLIAVAVVLAGYFAMQVVVSLWLLTHGLNPFPVLWAHIDPIATWLHLLAVIPVNAAWALPTVGWLLFWSAAVRAKPFLWAVVIPILAGVLNFWVGVLGLPHISNSFFLGNLIGRALGSGIPGSWLVVVNQGAATNALSNAVSPDRHIGTLGMAYGTFLTPQMWIGIIVGVALIAAAIWFRRWRDEA